MSIEKITMPQLGESVTEGTIEKWLVEPGDKVNKYDPIAEVVSDKVNAEIPSSFSGTIHERFVEEGATLPVGTVLCTIKTNKTKSLDSEKDISQNNNQTIQQKNEEVQIEKKMDIITPKRRYSPAVLALANEHNIDLHEVVGSGMEGRITRKDLLALINSGNIPQQTPFIKSQLQKEPSKEAEIVSVSGDVALPINSIRRAIANNMVRSKSEIPHAWMMIEVDVTDLVNYRNEIKDEFKLKEGFSITYFSFFIKAVSRALKEFPMMNSQWVNDQIIQKKDIHISIAVATEDALFVPVIKHADEKSIKGIAKEIYELSNLTRSGKLRSEHLQGGTFTVNNTGSFGSVQSMGIINYPQAAILQVEGIVKKPVILDGGMIAARDMVNLCLSLDHRILDGLICGKFLNRVKKILENVNNVTMPIY